MPASTSLRPQLARLFRDPSMLESRGRWQSAGFDVTGEGRASNIMVASHPSVPDYLFKRYSAKEVSLKKQLENYQRRIEGAGRLRQFTAQQLSRIAAPVKFLHALPQSSQKGAPDYVLVVERMELLDSSDSKRLYRAMPDEDLRQLCTVLFTFGGLDSGTRNVSFTSTGRIAFIDTERWNEPRKDFLHNIRKYLSDDQRRFADAFFKRRRPVSGISAVPSATPARVARPASPR